MGTNHTVFIYNIYITLYCFTFFEPQHFGLKCVSFECQIRNLVSYIFDQTLPDLSPHVHLWTILCRQQSCTAACGQTTV